MRKFLLLIVVLSFVLLPQRHRKGTAFFPIDVGYEWEYVVEINGKETPIVRYRVEEIKNDEHVILEIQRSFRDLSERRYISKNMMILQTGFGSQQLGGYKVFQKFPIEIMLPLKVGLEWEYVTDQGIVFFKKVIRWHEKFTTKYGDFKNVFVIFTNYNAEGVNWYSFSYYAFSVGLILEETSSDGYISLKTLKSYTIK